MKWFLLGGEFPSSGRGKLYGCGELGAAVGTGRAIDEGGRAKISGSQGGLNMLSREVGVLTNAESSSAISWCRSPSHLGGTSLS